MWRRPDALNTLILLLWAWGLFLSLPWKRSPLRVNHPWGGTVMSWHWLCQNSRRRFTNTHICTNSTLQGCKYQAMAAAGLTRWSRGSASSRWAVSGRWPWTCVRWLDAPSSGRLPASSWDACVHETRAPHSYSFLQQKNTEMHKQKFDNIHFHYSLYYSILCTHWLTHSFIQVHFPL